MVAGQTQPRDPPTADVPETQGAASSNDTCQGRAAGVCRAENAANAGSGDAGDGDLMLLEYLQNAQVREAASETPAKGEADTWPDGRGGPVAQVGLAVVPHERENASLDLPGPMGRASLKNSTDVLRANNRGRPLPEGQTVRSYYSRTLAVPLAPAPP